MKALRKEFWMEIRRSKSRFISILLIVALGVAFFSGIQASSPDMRYSGDAYYDESNLMDLKVVGTMGLTDADVKAIEAVDGVESAEGAWSTDVMCGDGEKQKVLHIEAINETVNSLERTVTGISSRHAVSAMRSCDPFICIVIIISKLWNFIFHDHLNLFSCRSC